MRGHRMGFIGLTLLAGTLVFLALANTKGSCVPVEPEGCGADADCGDGMYCDDGACAILGACETAEDCEGQPLIVPACVGFFSCPAGSCIWSCGVPVETCDPATPLDCGDQLVCVASTVDEPGTCAPFDHGQTVGAGYTCGGSIGVGCAEGLSCLGLPQGMVGGTGTCGIED